MHRTRTARATLTVLSLMLVSSASLSWASTDCLASTGSENHIALAVSSRPEIAVFAGGCFWSMENAFEGFPGVITVVSGYSGGHVANPSYEEVCEHTTGHLEAVEVTFDPARVSYAQLVDRFWHSIDPTQADGQFCDRGEPYESAIFVKNAGQQKVATASKAALAQSGVLKAPIMTVIRPFKVFYAAEEYHQDFTKKNPARYAAYRLGCGRDLRSAQIWGKAAARPMSH